MRGPLGRHAPPRRPPTDRPADAAPLLSCRAYRITGPRSPRRPAARRRWQRHGSPLALAELAAPPASPDSALGPVGGWRCNPWLPVESSPQETHDSPGLLPRQPELGLRRRVRRPLGPPHRRAAPPRPARPSQAGQHNRGDHAPESSPHAQITAQRPGIYRLLMWLRACEIESGLIIGPNRSRTLKNRPIRTKKHRGYRACFGVLRVGSRPPLFMSKTPVFSLVRDLRSQTERMCFATVSGELG